MLKEYSNERLLGIAAAVSLLGVFAGAFYLVYSVERYDKPFDQKMKGTTYSELSQAAKKADGFFGHYKSYKMLKE